MSAWQGLSEDFWADGDGGGGSGGAAGAGGSEGGGTAAGPGGGAASGGGGKPHGQPIGGGGGQCPNCGSRAIESLGPSGSSVCTDCGTIVEENALVSGVEFVDGAAGGSAMVGKFVGASGRTRGGGAGAGTQYGYSQGSRETTLRQSRNRIMDVASVMRLPNRFVDAAHRLYTVALEKNFVNGRRRTHVTAACLYCACRQEKSQHMLIDFSDAMQINVYRLGGTFLALRRMLGLALEIMDPALFIYRFAAHLNLEQKANAVSLTALRLVARMKRDWIVAGRRPQGICAAALLIASRAHGFRRGHEDVTNVLQVCGMTIMRRMKEFEHTSSSKLTLEEIHNDDLAPAGPEQDPPVFTQNRIREARARAVIRKDVDLLASGKLDNPYTSTEGGARWRKPREMTDREREESELYEELETEMTADIAVAHQKKLGMILIKGKLEAKEKTETKDNAETIEIVETKENGETKENAETIEIEEIKEGEDTKEKETKEDAAGEEPDPEVHILTDEERLALEPTELPHFHRPAGISTLHVDLAYPRGKGGKNVVLPDEATPEELMQSSQPVVARLHFEAWKMDLPPGSAEEVDDLFRNNDEVREREAVFNVQNKDYIKLQAEKDSKRLQAEASARAAENDDLAQEEGRARYLTKSGRSRKRRNSDGEEYGDELTTEEALMEVVRTRKTSRKINYDAMSALFDDSGNFATDLLDDKETDKDEGRIEEV